MARGVGRGAGGFCGVAPARGLGCAFMQPIATAPRDGTLIRLWLRSEVKPLTGYWSVSAQGWCPWREIPPLVQHDVTHWEPVQDEVAVRAADQGAAPIPAYCLGGAAGSSDSSSVTRHAANCGGSPAAPCGVGPPAT